jgi:hypothetical protein
MTFLAPLLSGIVIGLALMITSILNVLDMATLSGADLSGLGNIDNLIGSGGIFKLNGMIPPYYLQFAIGIYLIKIIFILTGTLVTIDSGEDKLEKTNRIGGNLKKGISFYFFTALFSALALFILTVVVLNGVLS